MALKYQQVLAIYNMFVIINGKQAISDKKGFIRLLLMNITHPYQNIGSVSLPLASSSHELSWGCKFADGVSISMDLQYDLISSTNYTIEWGMLFASAKLRCH